MTDLEAKVRAALKKVFDPELHINIVDLGLVYDVREEGGVVEVGIKDLDCPSLITLFTELPEPTPKKKGYETLSERINTAKSVPTKTAETIDFFIVYSVLKVISNAKVNNYSKIAITAKFAADRYIVGSDINPYAYIFCNHKLAAAENPGLKPSGKYV